MEEAHPPFEVLELDLPPAVEDVLGAGQRIPEGEPRGRELARPPRSRRGRCTHSSSSSSLTGGLVLDRHRLDVVFRQRPEGQVAQRGAEQRQVEAGLGLAEPSKSMKAMSSWSSRIWAGRKLRCVGPGARRDDVARAPPASPPAAPSHPARLRHDRRQLVGGVRTAATCVSQVTIGPTERPWRRGAQPGRGLPCAPVTASARCPPRARPAKTVLMCSFSERSPGTSRCTMTLMSGMNASGSAIVTVVLVPQR